MQIILGRKAFFFLNFLYIVYVYVHVHVYVYVYMYINFSASELKQDEIQSLFERNKNSVINTSWSKHLSTMDKFSDSTLECILSVNTTVEHTQRNM